MLNFKANAYEHLAAFHYDYTFDERDFDGALGFSLGYRYKDAIIPGFQLRYSRTTIGFNYDMIAGNKKSSLNRVSYELGLKHNFK